MPVNMAATGVTLSVSGLARELGWQREKVRRLIIDSGVQWVEMRGGHPAYALRDVLDAVRLADVADPDRMTPFERKAHYQALIERLKVETESGQLVPAGEVERTFAQAFTAMAQLLDTIPDILERDAGVGPAQLVAIEKAIDGAREELYLRLMQAEELEEADIG